MSVSDYVLRSLRDWRAQLERARFLLSAVRGRLAVASLGCEAATLSAMRLDAARCDQLIDLVAHAIGCHLDYDSESDCIVDLGEPCGQCSRCNEDRAAALDRVVDLERDRRSMEGLDT